MTTLETLTEEKTDLEKKIANDEAVIESATTSIYWNKKRIKLIDQHIKALPVKEEPKQEEKQPEA